MRIRFFTTMRRAPVRPKIALAAAVFAGAAALASVAVATSAFGGATRHVSPPSDPAAQTTTAQEILSLNTSWGNELSAWVSQTSDGRSCAFFQYDAVGTVPAFHPHANTAGAFCSGSPSSSGSGHLAVIASSVARGDGTYSMLVRGVVPSGAKTARVVLEDPSGAVTEFPSSQGYFAGELPGTTAGPDQVPAGGPYVLVGYDASGNAVAQINLAQVLRH